jgi:hypothetical protein
MSNFQIDQVLDSIGEKRLRNGLPFQTHPIFDMCQEIKAENLETPPDINQVFNIKESLSKFTENFSNQSFLTENFSLKGGAKKKSKKKSTSSNPSKKLKTSEIKEKSSKLSATFSPKMKKKSSSLTEPAVDLSLYTSLSKTINSSSPRKSPRSPSLRKVIFNLDQNMVLEFNKKKIISRAKITPKKKSSKGILKVRTSPRRNS